MKKAGIKISLGIISSVVLSALLFYFFLFLNPAGIYESNNLKWVPVLIAILSLYVSGRINKDTSIIALPLLFVPFILFKLFNYAYFPFILVLIVAGGLSLLVTRKNMPLKYQGMAWVANIGIFLFYLFTQPLIITHEGFGYDAQGELKNATVVWDFTENKDLKLPEHILKDKENNAFDMTDIKGKTHFVTFWATWCAPCIKEKPELEELKKRFEGHSQVEFIDISFDSDHSRWIEFLEDKQPLGLQLVSKDHKETSRELNFAGIPMHFIVDSEGVYKEYRSFEVAKQIIESEISEMR